MAFDNQAVEDWLTTFLPALDRMPVGDGMDGVGS